MAQQPDSGEFIGAYATLMMEFVGREAGFALVDAIAPSQLPTPEGERYEIRSIDEGAGEISLTLGARLSAGEVINQIEQSLGRTAREV